MIRGPDGVRQHVLFIAALKRPGENVDAIQAHLDEFQAWVEGTFDSNAYIYKRYAYTASLFLHDINNAVAVKLRWHGMIMME